MSWSELLSKRESEEGWVQLEFHPLTSQQACDEHRLLFATSALPLQNSSLAAGAYLDMLCPMQDKMEEREASEPPGGAVSLSKLKGLPVTRQVHDLLVSTGILTFNQLSSLLQCGRGQLPAYLEALGEHGVLVQGCWLVASHVLYPADTHSSLRDTRDYLLCCFSQARCIARKDVAVLTKVPHETVRQILASLTSGPGLEFKMPTDMDFIHKHPHIVQQQEERWTKRLQELRSAMKLPRDPHRSPSNEDSRKFTSRKARPPT